MTGTLSTSKITISPRMSVIQWFETAIESLRLPAGAEVPAERALASEIGVSRVTVAAALAELEERGVVVRRSKASRKRYIAGDAKSEASSLVSKSIVIFGGRANSKRPDGTIPKWIDEFISVSLLMRLSHLGKHVVLINQDNLEGHDLESCFNPPPAGVISINTVSECVYAKTILELCKLHHVPTVVYGNYPELEAFDRVYSDHQLGAHDVTHWLIGKGCKNIIPLFANEPHRNWEKRRYLGYVDAMQEAGLNPHPYVCYGMDDYDDEIVERKLTIFRGLILSKLLEIRKTIDFDAIICPTDQVAKLVISALRLMGLKPNVDVLVAGYDNNNEDDDYQRYEAEHSILTVDKHNEQLALLMTELLFERIEGKLPDKPQYKIQPHELVVRTN